jgi:hypothetical protein
MRAGTWASDHSDEYVAIFDAADWMEWWDLSRRFLALKAAAPSWLPQL